MKEKKLNKTARETRIKMKEALLKLFETKTINEITVMDIHEMTGYSRQTFYRHYKSVDEVCGDLITDYLREFLDMKNDETKLSLYEFICLFFDFMQGKRDIIQLLLKAGCLMILIELYFSLVLKLMDEFLPVKEELTSEERYRENLTVLGVIMSMAYYTFNNNFADTPEQLAGYVEAKLNL